ncbi:unnamed protein product [Discosporangium mesarthrocarpum]
MSQNRVGLIPSCFGSQCSVAFLCGVTVGGDCRQVIKPFHLGCACPSHVTACISLTVLPCILLHAKVLLSRQSRGMKMGLFCFNCTMNQHADYRYLCSSLQHISLPCSHPLPTPQLCFPAPDLTNTHK